EDVKQLIMSQLRDMQTHESFDSVMMSYKPNGDTRKTVTALGEVNSLMELATNNVRLIMDSIREIDPRYTEEQILSDVIYRLCNAKAIEHTAFAVQPQEGDSRSENP